MSRSDDLPRSKVSKSGSLPMLAIPATDLEQPQRPSSGRPPKTSRQEERHIVRKAGVQPTSSSVTIQHRFNLSSDGNRIIVWRPHGERLKSAFDLQQHTTPTVGVMVWGSFPTIHGIYHVTMTTQRYVYDILQTHVLPLMQWLPGSIFQQDNDRPHTARVSQDCLLTVTALLWPRPPVFF
ncbi:transposable element Tcb2 transposase [Trichonephila clavipes]|nr:transposable element Tcb2 transposase [Trichonephila clavipes]